MNYLKFTQYLQRLVPMFAAVSDFAVVSIEFLYLKTWIQRLYHEKFGQLVF